MIGSFLTRGLVMIFGYAYPAYECYKTVEKNKPEIEQLLFWCQYWILVALLTVCERIGDAFISWVPMYSEAKLAFFIYLWYPKTKGTTYVYDSFFRPYVAKHETEIDRNLLELKTRAGDIAVLYWQRVASYGQTRIYDVLQYVAAQSTPQRHPSQPQQPSARNRQRPAPPNRQPASPAQPQTEEPPPSPTSSTSSSQHHEEEEAGSSLDSKAAADPAASAAGDPQKATVPSEVTPIQAAPTEAEPKPMQTEEEAEAAAAAAAPSSTEDNTNPAPKEPVMEETIRSTRGRLRKTRSVGKPSKNDS